MIIKRHNPAPRPIKHIKPIKVNQAIKTKSNHIFSVPALDKIHQAVPGPVDAQISFSVIFERAG